MRSTLFSAIMAASMGVGLWLSSVLDLYAQFGVLALGLSVICAGAVLSRTIRRFE